MKRAQISMEFMILTITAIAIIGIVVLFVHNKQQEYSQEFQNAAIEDFAYSLQQEFFSASTMHDGFEREIVLPDRIYNKLYSVTIINNNLYVTQDQYEMILPLPSVNGNIPGSTFTIKVEAGQVEVVI
jgi:uncharacterized protein (UPF0333 family)